MVDETESRRNDPALSYLHLKKSNAKKEFFDEICSCHGYLGIYSREDSFARAIFVRKRSGRTS